jgi:hypothetical protein
MTAKGKINASNVNETHRIIVKVSADGTVRESATKTGEGVQVARVIAKTFRAAQGPYEARGKYVIETSAGTFEAAPIQTMWLAPEDAAGVKRARAEAELVQADILAEEKRAAESAKEAELADEAAVAYTEEIERAETYNAATGTQDAQPSHRETTAQCANRWHRSAPVRGLILCPECPTVAPAPAGAAPAAADLLAALEPPRVLDLLPPLAAGKELVRVADIASSNLLTLDSHAGKVGLNSEDDTEEPEMTATTETQTPAQTATDHTGSTVVALIERVWDRIRADHPELPAVVVTTGSGEFVKWGHFRPNSWKTVGGEKRHEFFLASEALAKGARQVLQTTIHEAAHTLSNVRNVQDTSRQHRYHNGTFRKTAEELGLEHKASKPDKTLGFSFVTLTQETIDRYADLLADLERELTLTGLLPFWLGGDQEDEDERGGEKITKPKGEDGEDGESKPQSGNLKATCGCEEPKIIRLSRKVLDLKVVQCNDCDELFTA